MEALWNMSAFVLHLLGAMALLVMCAWVFPRRDRLGTAGSAIIGAAATTGMWGLLAAAFGPDYPAAIAVLSISHLTWLLVLYRLFASDGRHSIVRPVRPVIVVLACVELSQLALQVLEMRFGSVADASEMLFQISVTFRLLCAVGALVLTHNLYAGASPAGRLRLRWPATALAAIWLYDLNLYAVAYLSGEMPVLLGTLRGVLMIVVSVLLSLAAAVKGWEIRLRASRSVAFQSFSLFVIGGYLVGMVLIAQALSYLGSEAARLVQVSFLAAASVVALLVLPSRKMRSWAKVMLAKHLFQHRYDYRAEWLRFTQTIARGGEHVLPLHERVVQAVADITDSPAGLLLTPLEDGGAGLVSRWQWGDADVPSEALSADAARFFQDEQFILDLDDLRAGRMDSGERASIPAWLIDNRRAWAMVPLIHYQRLVGIVVLARPAVMRRLDWEDFDLLRVVGQQLASYLAEQAGQEALSEAHRFDEFNRRMAFVMHDIKNLASQLSLLARNAQKHADKPEFRADMLVTLRNSSDKLNALLARLGRYGAGGSEKIERIDAGECAERVVRRYEAQHAVQIIERHDCDVLGDAEGFEQALVHLVQNAIEASEPASPVLLSVTCDSLYCRIEVVDAGVGMNSEFLRTRLFKPFHSSKPGGFGIGAYEARELIRAMNGQLSVESREGFGTRFTIRLPLAVTAEMAREVVEDMVQDQAEVA